MFFAAQSPRGFANETIAHGFHNRRQDDEWVEQNQDADDAACHAYAVTYEEATRIIHYRGDAATQSYNGFVRHEGLITESSAGWGHADTLAA